jgi:hypothetical protein
MPSPVVLRIKLRYEDVDAMVQRFAPNVGKLGLFLPTRSIQPVGTEVKFELRLANDTPVLVGLGVVRQVKPPDPDNPKATFGIAIELSRVSREGRELIIRMIERRRVLGLPDVTIPIPESAEAARRNEVDTQPRADTSGIVKEAMAQFASAPVQDQILTRETGPVATLITGPVGIVKEPGRDTGPIPRDSGLLTSPRVAGGAVAALAPEPPRARRPRIADVIAMANEAFAPAVADVPGLDEQVDIERAMTLARSLATGTDLDAELSALRESAAAPTTLSVEAASAELARQLGGSPIVHRDHRGAGWAPPPAVETRSGPAPGAAEELEALRGRIAEPEPRAEPEPEPAPERAAEPEHAAEAEPEPAPVVEHRAEDDAPIAYQIQPRDADDDIEREYAADQRTRIPTGDETYDPDLLVTPPRPLLIADDVDPDRFARELEADLGENTQIGSIPIDPSVGDQIDRQLVDAEAEADADLALAMQQEPRGYDPYSYRAPQGAVPAPIDDEEEAELIDDADVLAIADEDDADLLTSHGEHEASGSRHAAPEVAPAQRHYDFHAQLDLDEDPANPNEFDDRHASYEHRRHASNSDDAALRNSYTFSESFAQAGLPHAEGEEFDEPHSYGQQRHEAQIPEPRYLGQESDPFELATPVPGERSADDLEDALAALDVDDLSLERSRAPRVQQPAAASKSRPLPGLPIHRPTEQTPPAGTRRPITKAHTVQRSGKPQQQSTPSTTSRQQQPNRPETDDGVLIDFDDDE